VSGRKPKHESRAEELLMMLAAWSDTAESERPSLRALARDLRVSHQLLGHYLKRVHSWQGRMYSSQAEAQAQAIRARALAEKRPMTPNEQELERYYEREAGGAAMHGVVLEQIAKIKRKTKHSPPSRQQIKMVKVLARVGIVQAQDLLRELVARQEDRAK
jgi:hypothetical protein